MKLTKENFEDFIERLKHHNRGDGVNDHCTANPLFVVQSLKRVSGIDLKYAPKHFWTDSDHEVEWNDEEFAEVLAEYEGEYDEFDPDYDDSVTRGNEILFEKIGYAEDWEYECAHLTKEGAETFIKRKAHDHWQLRIFVDSQYWCWEFNAIIEGLLDGKIGMVETV